MFFINKFTPIKLVSQIFKLKFQSKNVFFTHSNSNRTRLINNKNCYSNFRSSFHTTPQRNINPLFFALFKPVSKMASMFTGRFLRIWWRKLTPEQKLYYKNQYFKNPKFWAIPLNIFIIGGGLYYYTHIQTTPVTNRKRFIGISDDQMMKLSEFELSGQLEQNRENVVNPNHPFYKKVQHIVQKIVDNNQDLEKMKTQKWTIYVIDNNESNAFVLPTGQIFIFSGLMKYISNDDELAYVLGHEIAHAVLNHGLEQVSFTGIVDLIVIVSMAIIWAIMPGDGIAMVTQWFYNKVLDIMLHLPYSRQLELEADEVGLRLIAKACFDIRQASTMWLKWSLLGQLEGDDDYDLPTFLSTHPDFEERSRRMDSMMEEMISLRTLCKCPDLKPATTNNDLERLKKLVGEKKSKKVDLNNNKVTK